LLDNPSGVHHQHPMTDLGDDPQVVGDQDDAGPATGLQVAEQVEDLRLDRNVECRCRLVSDQDIRFAGKGHGDHDPLTHPPAELVRVIA
jgi:hypothetical protein